MAPLVLCQRIGCDCEFDPNERRNEEEQENTNTNVLLNCVYHPEPPRFHDGDKIWPCCGKRSKDFTEFLNIKGCAKGQHTQEKPNYDLNEKEKKTVEVGSTAATAAASEEERKKKESIGTEESEESVKTCLRCSSGFLCSVHPKASKEREEEERKKREIERKESIRKAREVVVDVDREQTCKNPGCGEKFRERENREDSCKFHKGKPIFHERSKGWSCCANGRKCVYDFDEFLLIPTCSIGRHSAFGVEDLDGGDFAKRNG